MNEGLEVDITFPDGFARLQAFMQPILGEVGLPNLGGSTHRFVSHQDFDPEYLGLAGLTYAK